MKDDLISRSVVVDIIHEEINKTHSYLEHDTQINILAAVSELPVAYDADKVVEQIKNCDYCDANGYLNPDAVVEIVKAGGIEL